MPATSGAWDPQIQPTRADCSFSPHQCVINIKTGKNMKLAGQSRTITLLPADKLYCCPVRAMSRVLTDTPTISPRDPILMFPDNRAPVPCSFIIKQIHLYLKQFGHVHLIPKISLHSLRKSVATNAFVDGCSQLSIKNFGGWSSDAYTTYIRTQNRKVTNSLISSVQNC